MKAATTESAKTTAATAPTIVKISAASSRVMILVPPLARSSVAASSALPPPAPRPRVRRPPHLRDDAQPLLITHKLPPQLHDPVPQQRRPLELQVLGGA